MDLHWVHLGHEMHGYGTREHNTRAKRALFKNKSNYLFVTMCCPFSSKHAYYSNIHKINIQEQNTNKNFNSAAHVPHVL